MRLISQDGLLDVSYENVMLNIYDVDRAVVIKAYYSVSSNDFICMGLYETLEKAETVMKMVRGAWLGESVEFENGFYHKNCVFRFPADDEVEV